MIALMSSVPEEGRLLVKRLKDRSFVAGKPVYEGRIHGKEVIHMVSGMGKVNAAHAATILLEKFSPRVLILFGVGGAYPSAGLQVGDIAVAEKELYGDEGVVTGDGFHGTEFIGIPLVRKGGKKYFNRFALDTELVTGVMRSAKLLTPHASRVTGVKSGTFVTVSTCTGTRRRALELQKRFGGICENMEGAAVAHICAHYGTPLAELRGISNIVEDRDTSKWNIRLAAENCQRVVMELVKTL